LKNYFRRRKCFLPNARDAVAERSSPGIVPPLFFVNYSFDTTSVALTATGNLLALPSLAKFRGRKRKSKINELLKNKLDKFTETKIKMMSKVFYSDFDLEHTIKLIPIAGIKKDQAI
jgi:hypothetical protein